MKKITLLILSVLFILAKPVLWAQKDSTANVFKPKGKMILTLFGDFHSEFTDTKNTGFSIERAYLGYQYQFTEGLSAKVVLDVGKSSEVFDLTKLAYLKNACITWHKGNFTLHAGLTGMEQFSVQEKAWGHRYLYKSFQDQYKFGSSADLGLVAQYKFTSWVKADFTFVNGDGYKNLKMDPYFLYGLGVTFNPISSLTLRVYGSYHDQDSTLTGQENLTLFVGYKGKKVGVGAEYATIWNAKGEFGKNMQGVSAFVTLKLPKKFELFARYDLLLSQRRQDQSKDEMAALIGFQYSPNSHFKISPNFRAAVPRAGVSEITLLGYLNIEVKM